MGKEFAWATNTHHTAVISDPSASARHQQPVCHAYFQASISTSYVVLEARLGLQAPTRPNFYGLRLRTYGISLEGPSLGLSLGLESCIDNFLARLSNSIIIYI